jgi:rSAM/selenodomain-associated transferase 2
VKLSVIVPVLNEAGLIREFVSHLRTRLPDAEIIVVDGGSDDGTFETLQDLSRPSSLRLLRASRGRAIQMNAGAQVATGDILLFLHADSSLPADAANSIREQLQDPRTCGGCFRLRFPRRELVYRVSDSLGNVAVDLFGIALGDHGIFCRKDIFFRAGGYPLVPLMEDAELYRRLKRFGRIRQLPVAIETSPRRYEELGRYRTTLFYLCILILYLARVSPWVLERCYRRFTVAKSGDAARTQPKALSHATVEPPQTEKARYFAGAGP